jgi:hypothetical protein
LKCELLTCPEVLSARVRSRAELLGVLHSGS